MALDQHGDAAIRVHGPWTSTRPEIRARVVSPNGTEHWFDPSLLTETPATERRLEPVRRDGRTPEPQPAQCRATAGAVRTALSHTEP